MTKIAMLILLSLSVFVLHPSLGWTESKYSIKEMTPEVQAALDRRRERFDQLAELKKKGVIGENNRGYVEVITNGEGAEGIVDAENKDRKVIYQTIAEQNDLKGEIDTIEKVFAEVQKEKAQTGDKIQDDQGRWTYK